MAKSEFKVIATWGSMKSGRSEFLTDYVKADSEDDVYQEFTRNIVNRFYGREIVHIQKIKDLH